MNNGSQLIGVCFSRSHESRFSLAAVTLAILSQHNQRVILNGRKSSENTTIHISTFGPMDLGSERRSKTSPQGV